MNRSLNSSPVLFNSKVRAFTEMMISRSDSIKEIIIIIKLIPKRIFPNEALSMNKANMQITQSSKLPIPRACMLRMMMIRV